MQITGENLTFKERAPMETAVAEHLKRGLHLRDFNHNIPRRHLSDIAQRLHESLLFQGISRITKDQAATEGRRLNFGSLEDHEVQSMLDFLCEQGFALLQKPKAGVQAYKLIAVPPDDTPSPQELMQIAAGEYEHLACQLRVAAAVDESIIDDDHEYDADLLGELVWKTTFGNEYESRKELVSALKDYIHMSQNR